MIIISEILIVSVYHIWFSPMIIFLCFICFSAIVTSQNLTAVHYSIVSSGIDKDATAGKFQK